MPAIYVCSKRQVPDAARSLRPSHLITLLDPADHMPTPEEVQGHRHLKLGMHDISDIRAEFVAPAELHVREIISFAESWDCREPMLVHCWAGISRSTASAFTIACMLSGPGRELEVARLLRARAAHAHPNMRIVALADALLDRQGRMIEAIDSIGPGKVAFEGELFAIPARY